MYSTVKHCRRCDTALIWDPETKANVPAPVGFYDEASDVFDQYTPTTGCPGTFMGGRPCEPKPYNP